MDIPSKGLKNTSNGNCALKMEDSQEKIEMSSSQT